MSVNARLVLCSFRCFGFQFISRLGAVLSEEGCDFVLGEVVRAIERRFAIEIDCVHLALAAMINFTISGVRTTLPMEGRCSVSFVSGVRVSSSRQMPEDNFLFPLSAAAHMAIPGVGMAVGSGDAHPANTRLRRCFFGITSRH
ncbi:MAG: hypothetical protein Ct9H300mP7_5190 [Verrucomicrobiota bacterium]|nr:MAG: hypothetical protein Ct9H300mP7_5190 [Verrucomicrobiota bacterium]